MPRTFEPDDWPESHLPGNPQFSAVLDKLQAPASTVLMTDVLLIGLVGQAGVGKTTAADYLEQAHGFVQHALAEPLRTMLHALFAELGLDYAHLYEPHMKHLPIPELGGVTARRLMQTLGTEWGRDLIAEDLWLRAADMILGMPTAPVHDRLLITDVRFASEAEWLRKHGGHLVRIQRASAPGTEAHISEQQANGIAVDHELHNNGSIEGLHHDLDTLLAALLAGRAAS